MQSSNSPEIYPADGSYGTALDGLRESDPGMGTEKNGSVFGQDQGNDEKEG